MLKYLIGGVVAVGGYLWWQKQKLTAAAGLDGFGALDTLTLDEQNAIKQFQRNWRPLLNTLGVREHFTRGAGALPGFPPYLSTTGRWDAPTVYAFTGLLGEYIPIRGGYAFGRNLAEAWMNSAAGVPLTGSQRSAINRFSAQINFLLSLPFGNILEARGFVEMPVSGPLDETVQEALMRMLGGDETFVTNLMSSHVKFANTRAAR